MAIVSGKQTQTSKYGKITGDHLLFNGKYFKIDYVVKDTLILKTDKLHGKYGDEFPLSLVK